MIIDHFRHNETGTRSTEEKAAITDSALPPDRVRGVLGRALEYGLLVGFLILCALLAAISPVFLTPINLLNVALRAAVVAILAFGQTFVILTAGIDLSVGSVLGLTGPC